MHNWLAKITGAVFLLFGLHDPAQAGFADGNKLKEVCAQPEGTMEHGFCIGFIAGVHDSLETSEILYDNPDTVCTPAEASLRDMRDAAIKYLDNHPDDLEVEASALVVVALKEAFPCRT